MRQRDKHGFELIDEEIYLIFGEKYENVSGEILSEAADQIRV